MKHYTELILNCLCWIKLSCLALNTITIYGQNEKMKNFINEECKLYVYVIYIFFELIISNMQYVTYLCYEFSKDK